MLDRALGPVRPGVDPWAGIEAIDGVGLAVASARDAADLVLRDRGHRRVTPAMTTESLLRGAVSAAWLDGGDASDDAVRAGIGDDRADRTVRVYAELPGLGPDLTRVPLGVLARLHTLAAAGAVPTDDLGRPRDLAAAKVLRSLGERLTGPTRAPGLVVAALVYAELVVSSPFASANLPVACAVERALLLASGFDPASVLVPEAGHWRLRAAEPALLTRLADGSARAIRDWLLHASAVIAVAVAESPLTCERRPHRGDAAR